MNVFKEGMKSSGPHQGHIFPYAVLGCTKRLCHEIASSSRLLSISSPTPPSIHTREGEKERFGVKQCNFILRHFCRHNY